MEKFEILLKNFKSSNAFSHKKEKTVFDIGARGYYENPTSDILAFFIDSNEEHGLGNLVLGAIFDCLELDLNTNIISVSREIVTKENKRIDILVESDEWVMAIENKIYHSVNNPFEQYNRYLETNYKGKKLIKILLSPSGDLILSKELEWKSISYFEFIENINKNIGCFFVDVGTSKWLIFLREFCLHMTQLTGEAKRNMNDESFVFLMDNLKTILELEKFRKKVLDSFFDEFKHYFNDKYSEFNLMVKLHHWFDGPALRFAFEHWSSYSDVVLYMDTQDGNKFDVRTYVCNLNESLLEKAKCYFSVEEYTENWMECKSTVLALCEYLDNISKISLFEKIEEHLIKLNEFEKNREEF